MNLSWKLGRVAGIDLYLHPTFLILLALVGAGEGGMLSVLLLSSAFGCVLLHELGHALTARAFGIGTQDITLYPIGGVARLERLPRKPGPELLITLAGPAVNLALAGLFSAIGAVVGWAGPGSGFDRFAVAYLSAMVTINLLLAGFNLIPAFPMDGGRILRAGLTGWLGRLRATELAAGLGQLLAVVFGFWSLLQGHWVQAFLAVFVYVAAAGELARVRGEDGDDRPRRDDPDDGVWVAPPGHRWIRVGRGVWQLAPIRVDGASPWR